MDISEMMNQILSTDEGKEGLEQIGKMMENGDLDLSSIMQMFGESSENTDEKSEKNSESDSGGGLFDGLDLDTMLKFAEIFEKMNKPDENSKLLLALKPLLRTENQEKIDKALKYMKIAAILPYLKEGGLFDKLF